MSSRMSSTAMATISKFHYDAIRAASMERKRSISSILRSHVDMENANFIRFAQNAVMSAFHRSASLKASTRLAPSCQRANSDLRYKVTFQLNHDVKRLLKIAAAAMRTSIMRIIEKFIEIEYVNMCKERGSGS